MDLGGGADVIDMGAEEAFPAERAEDASSIDFVFDEPDTGASVTQEMPPAALEDAFDEATVAADTDEESFSEEVDESTFDADADTIDTSAWFRVSHANSDALYWETDDGTTDDDDNDAVGRGHIGGRGGHHAGGRNPPI